MDRRRASFAAASIPMLAMLVATLVPLPGSSAAGPRRCGLPPDAWVALNPRGAPSVRTETPVVEMGGRLLVFGQPGAIFDPCANRWRPMAKGAPSFAIGPGHTHPALVAGERRRQEIRYENDPAGPKGCGPRVPGQPICDPVMGVREVRVGPGGQEGGMLGPVFVAAAKR